MVREIDETFEAAHFNRICSVPDNPIPIRIHMYELSEDISRATIEVSCAYNKGDDICQKNGRSCIYFDSLPHEN